MHRCAHIYMNKFKGLNKHHWQYFPMVIQKVIDDVRLALDSAVCTTITLYYKNILLTRPIVSFKLRHYCNFKRTVDNIFRSCPDAEEPIWLTTSQSDVSAFFPPMTLGSFIEEDIQLALLYVGGSTPIPVQCGHTTWHFGYGTHELCSRLRYVFLHN